MTPVVQLHDGGYRYDGSDRWIFRHLEFEVSPGEVIQITGRNGSGKTTLLKALSGILRLTEGGIRTDDHTRIAYMDQSSGSMLAPDLTVLEQLTMAAQPDGLSPRAACDLLTEFDIGLAQRTLDFVGHLSGGQRQVVAVVCTLAAGAHVVCLDEFTSSMDERTAAVAGRLLQHVRQSGTALLIVAHGGVVGIPIDREFTSSIKDN